MAYSDVILADTPKMYYRALGTAVHGTADNGNKGAVDISGNNLHLVGWNNGAEGLTYPKDGASLITGDANPSMDFARNSNVWMETHKAGMELPGGSGVTMSFWAKNTDTSWPVASFSDTVRKGNAYAMFIDPHITLDHVLTGRVQLTNVTQYDLIAQAQVFINTRYHFAMTFETATGIMRLFINGAKVAERTDLPNLGLIQDTQTLVMGQFAGSGNAWVGLLDEVAIFDHALTPARIAAHYNAGLAAAGGGTGDTLSGTSDVITPTRDTLTGTSDVITGTRDTL